VAFKPPSASAGQLAGISFDQAVDFAPAARARFDAFDKTAAGKKDPSMCKALLRFPNGGPADDAGNLGVKASYEEGKIEDTGKQVKLSKVTLSAKF
jgi:hypothetical protein